MQTSVENSKAKQAAAAKLCKQQQQAAKQAATAKLCKLQQQAAKSDFIFLINSSNNNNPTEREKKLLSNIENNQATKISIHLRK